MNTMLTSYLDAVRTALRDAGIETFGHGAATEDGRAERLHINLASKWADESPVLVWTPEAGWRLGVAVLGAVPPATIRYVHAGAVPSPAYVAESVARWQVDAQALTDVAPAYEVEPSRLDGLLAEAAGVPAVQELAAAIRTALDTPEAIDSDGRAKRDRLLTDRAAYVYGALRALAAGEDPVLPASTCVAVREAATLFPVTYPTRDEQDGADR